MSYDEQTGPFSPGDTLLDQYQVRRLLGVGGHAYVYECHDRFLDELLAVKVIPNPPNRGRALLDRARAEAQLLRRLSHPNLVRVHTAAALGEDMVCLVMEKLEGVTLRHLLALLGRLSVAEAASIVRQVATGVAAAHELNVIHRDIKPDNAFVLPPRNQVKVLDFGIAKFLGQGLQTSNKYRFQGTPLYMCPEQLRGAGVTVRSDVYQLGTVFFELVAGVNPNLIDVDNPNFEQIAFVQLTRPVPHLSKVVAAPLESLDWLIQKATSKDPAQRFATMDEFILALDRTTTEYLATHPEESGHIRYVDEALIRAAKDLAAREAAGEFVAEAAVSRKATPPVATTMPMGVTAVPRSGQQPTLVTTQRQSSPPQCLPSSPPQTGREADRAPLQRAVPCLQAQGDRHAHSGGPTRAGKAVPVLPKTPRRLSIGFYLAALAFGAAIGLVILWFSPGKAASIPPHPADSVSVIAASAAEQTVDPIPSSVPTSLGSANREAAPPAAQLPDGQTGIHKQPYTQARAKPIAIGAAEVAEEPPPRHPEQAPPVVHPPPVQDNAASPSGENGTPPAQRAMSNSVD
jgi:serine/threonine protein kinase